MFFHLCLRLSVGGEFFFVYIPVREKTSLSPLPLGNQVLVAISTLHTQPRKCQQRNIFPVYETWFKTATPMVSSPLHFHSHTDVALCCTSSPSSHHLPPRLLSRCGSLSYSFGQPLNRRLARFSSSSLLAGFSTRSTTSATSSAEK